MRKILALIFVTGFLFFTGGFAGYANASETEACFEGVPPQLITEEQTMISYAQIIQQADVYCPQGMLWCITYFCNTVGLYCCPRGFPYLNHYDCLCYSQPPNVPSYSQCFPR